MIETTGLGKRYGSFWALRDCSVEVPAGSVCALVGANGAGKSTLIRLLAGLAHASSGTATVNGRTPGGDSAFLAEIGYLAQDVPLYPRWSVETHLRFAEKTNARWDEGTARERLASLQIPLDRQAGALSGGMRAQVALALALGKRPSVLILDEPVAALDPLARRDFLGTLTAAVAEAEGNLTVLMSSHSLSDLERVCDHLILMADGRPVLCDDVDQLLASHRVVSGAGVDLDPVDGEHVVVEQQQLARHSSLLIRMDGPVRADGWQIDDAGLEEIVLAYLRMQHEQKERVA